MFRPRCFKIQPYPKNRLLYKSRFHSSRDDNKELTVYTNFNPELKAGIEVKRNLGLKKFLQRTYISSMGGICGGLLLAESVALTPFSGNSLLCIGSGILATVSGIIALNKGKYTIVHDENKCLKVENSITRKLGYSSLVGGMGLTLSPIVSTVSPTILTSAICLSFLTMTGASLFAYKCKSGSLLKYGPALTGGLFGLVGLQILGLGSYLIIGPNILYESISNIDSYGGIVLFSFLTASNTHDAIEMYKNKDPDHLKCATNFYMDFMNILIRFIGIMAKSKR